RRAADHLVGVGHPHEQLAGGLAVGGRQPRSAADAPARPRLPRPHRPVERAGGRARWRAARRRRLRAPRGRVARHAAVALPVGAGVTALDPAFVADATVEVNDVSVWFGQKVALSELSCSFGPGVTGLLGPNGAGKTTLMRAISGLIPVAQGS